MTCSDWPGSQATLSGSHAWKRLPAKEVTTPKKSAFQSCMDLKTAIDDHDTHSPPWRCLSAGAPAPPATTPPSETSPSGCCPQCCWARWDAPHAPRGRAATPGAQAPGAARPAAFASCTFRRQAQGWTPSAPTNRTSEKAGLRPRRLWGLRLGEQRRCQAECSGRGRALHLQRCVRKCACCHTRKSHQSAETEVLTHTPVT